MAAESNHSPFQGQNRLSAILITLFLSTFALALFYVFYRQFNGRWERPGLINPWRNTFARTADQNEKPILWDVYVGGEEKVKWEWDGFKVSEPFGYSRRFLVVAPSLGWFATLKFCLLNTCPLHTVASVHGCARHHAHPAVDAKTLAKVLERGGRDGTHLRDHRLSVTKKTEVGICARSGSRRLRYRDHRSAM